METAERGRHRGRRVVDEPVVKGARVDGPSGPTSEEPADGAGGEDVAGALAGETLEVVHDALRRVRAEIGDDALDSGLGPSEVSSAVDHATVAAELRRGWDVAIAAARSGAESPEGAADLASLIEVLNVLHVADEYLNAGPPRRGRSMSRVRERLQALTSASSLSEMIDNVPVVAAGLGFDRVLLSRVEESTWFPERLYIRGDATRAEEILEALSREPLLLDASLLESQMVRRGVPLRVVDPANRPLTHRLMIELSGTHGYIAAPIMDGGRVAGFLHADCHHQSRVPTPGDLETLWLFSQALGPMLARQALVERLAAIRTEAETPLAVFGSGTPRAPVDPAESTAGRPPRRRAPAPPPEHALHSAVTEREADVLRLVAEGASNEQIARRLAISVGTVKSHLKRILRKLDVANRAEAASLWLRSEYGHRPPGRGR